MSDYYPANDIAVGNSRAETERLLDQADALLRQAEKLVPVDSEAYLMIGDALTAVSAASGCI